MAGYYELLQRSELGRSASREEREAAYDRARHVLLKRLLAEDPPLPASIIRAEQASLDAAIQRFDGELVEPESDHDQIGTDTPAPLLATPRRTRIGFLVCIVGAVTLLIVGSLGYLYWSYWLSSAKSGPQGPRATPTQLVEFDDRQPAAVGSTDDALPYIFKRQLVYYRTTQPVGTVIIDKAQRYLYLIRSTIVAARYGIGVGRECLNAGGLLRVSHKEERLQSRQPAGFVSQPDPGRQDSPLGSRTIYLDGNVHFIHGTRIPKSIGRSVWLGCFRLIDNDVIELYDLVPVGRRVVVTN